MPDWQPRSVAWAERVTVRRLEVELESALLRRAGRGPAFERCLAEPARAQDPIPDGELQLCAHDIEVDATERLDWRAPREVASLFLVVHESFRARLRTETDRRASDSAAFAAMLGHVGAPRPEQPPSDPVFDRDGATRVRCRAVRG